MTLARTPSEELSGIPTVNIPANLQAALSGGRQTMAILTEVVRLRRGAGMLTPSEYFYYRLWNPSLPMDDKLRFVGKQAQHPMHMACNHTGWYAAAADKLLFHTVMAGARLPTPTLLATTGAGRGPTGVPHLNDAAEIAAFLREPDRYPLFAKPIDGKYSLCILSGDAIDRPSDRILRRGQAETSVATAAAEMSSREAGFIIERRLGPDSRLAGLFGPCLWSVRLLVLLTPTGPVIHRAVAKIATGTNAADNFWRPGNMLGAIELTTGTITRLVRGTGIETAVNLAHPDTGVQIVGAVIPDWGSVLDLTAAAACVLPGIRTQSWDVALTDSGPVLLEVNFGGDLNLAQLASGAGVLDDQYREHLGRCGYRC